MHIYRFRLLSDINDEFVRDIELMASQSFLDFHNMISECVNLNGKELASFHVCDQKWNKMKEITLIDMLDGEDKEEETKPIEETFIMKDSLIKNFIEEPHQRLLYEYDLFNMNTFFIELLSVHKQKDDGPYPKCCLKKGDLTQEPVPQLIEEQDEELTEQMLNDFNDLLDDTYDYKGDSDSSEIIPE